ncbi:FAD-binding oxidoreductase [Akkermansiaceae bacterium]|nr:FAD-binding oxidoreductase [Akkermansiaceae bacterium]
MNDKFLIVGQGLAGSALSMALIEEGHHVTVVDDSHKDSASVVAAGLITTLAGKGMNPSWRQAEYLETSVEYFRELEETHGVSLLHDLPIYRPFFNQKESAKFERKRELVKDWVAEDHQVNRCINHPYGGFTMKSGGRLDVLAYLQLVEKLLGARLHRAQLDLEDKEEFALKEDAVYWRGERFDKMILCTGYSGLVDRFFKSLPSRPAKGEMLDVRIAGLATTQIISSGGWLVPLGDDLWRAGATYSWDPLDTLPSEAGRLDVMQKIPRPTTLPFTVESHLVGVRPIVNKSQPVIGMHEEFPQVGIFNGLGSKGVITSIPVARHFVEVLMGKKTLDPELDVNRIE